MENPMITTPKTFCFVLMPFRSEFDDIYQIGIKEACDKASAYCERVDEQIFTESILDRIYNQISKADIVIADMTDRSPNVFYEVGYAHALGKLTILLTQNADDIPFDLKHFPHIEYGKKISVLRDELENRIKYFIDNPPDKISDTKLGLDLYLENENLMSGNAIYEFNPSPGYINLRITAYNSSTNTITFKNFKIGVVTDLKRGSPNAVGIENILLPDGMKLYMLHNNQDLFPDGYASYYLQLKKETPMDETIYVRLFTTQGKRDFPIKLIAKTQNA